MNKIDAEETLLLIGAIILILLVAAFAVFGGGAAIWLGWNLGVKLLFPTAPHLSYWAAVGLSVLYGLVRGTLKMIYD